MSNEITTIQPQSMAQYLSQEAVQRNLVEVLGDRKAEFITSVVSIANANVKLKACDRGSLLAACMTAAALNLPVNQNLGFAYIIPYKNQAQFQIGYKGLKQLALRTAQYRFINATAVGANEYGGINRVTGEVIIKEILEDERGEVVGYLSYFELVTGFKSYLYMTIKELQAHGLKYSQSYKYSHNVKSGDSLWETDFDAMAKKTVTKLNLSRNGVLTKELQRAIEVDQGVIDGDKIHYVDNEKPSIQVQGDEKNRERIITYIQKAKTQKALDRLLSSIEGDEQLQKLWDEKSQTLITEAIEKEVM